MISPSRRRCENVVHVVERVRLRAQDDVAAAVQLQQLPEVDPGADEVARDDALVRDQVHGVDVDLAAVADQREDAAAREQLEPEVVRALGADDVEDDVRAGAGGQLADRSGDVLRGAQHLVRSELACERASALVRVDRDDRARSEHAQELEGDVADTADPDHDRAVVPEPSCGTSFLTAW